MTRPHAVRTCICALALLLLASLVQAEEKAIHIFQRIVGLDDVVILILLRCRRRAAACRQQAQNQYP